MKSGSVLTRAFRFVKNAPSGCASPRSRSRTSRISVEMNSPFTLLCVSSDSGLTSTEPLPSTNVGRAFSGKSGDVAHARNPRCVAAALGIRLGSKARPCMPRKLIAIAAQWLRLSLLQRDFDGLRYEHPLVVPQFTHLWQLPLGIMMLP